MQENADSSAVTEDLRRQAAVLIASQSHRDGERILLTLRAAHMNQHAGEVAFPGGKWEPGDLDLEMTALRETYEEVGVAGEQVTVTARLPAGYTRAGVKVTPFVGRLAEAAVPRANPDEIASVFWLPVEVLLEDRRVRTDVFNHRDRRVWAPVYQHQGYTIWGFTARMLVGFAAYQYGVEFDGPPGTK